jgi:hypothetical protein
MSQENPTAEDALRLLAQLDDDEQCLLLRRILFDPAAPLHGLLDTLLQTCLHAMKSAVHVFVSCRDKPSNGGRLWAAHVLGQIKKRLSWRELLRKAPGIPEAALAVKILSPIWQGEPLWIDDRRGGTPREPEYERIRKAIRDLENHARAKAAKSDEVYQLVLASLPPWVREAFPGIESYLKLYGPPAPGQLVGQ